MDKPHIQVISDLHTEFDPNQDELQLEDYLAPSAPILLIAGDLGLPRQAGYLNFLRQASDAFETVLVIAGNHEFYQGTESTPWGMQKLEDEMRRLIAPLSNVHYLQNQEYTLNENVVVLGCTLWTRVREEQKQDMVQHMNDYRLIYHETPTGLLRRVTVDDTNPLHDASVAWLEHALKQYAGKCVIVMTHHLPSFELIARQYAGHPINAGFATDLNPLIRAHPQLRYWIAGHTHTSFDVEVEGCRCVVNPRGYPRADGTLENNSYDRQLCVEIKL